MSDKSFHITFGSMKDLMNEARNALKTRKGSPHPSAMFSDVNEFMSFMFPGKFLILMMIKSKKPSSMYELAVMVSRSQSGVLRECKELEASGFITLKQEGARNSLKPELSFDYDRLAVHLDVGDSFFVLPTYADAA